MEVPKVGYLELPFLQNLLHNSIKMESEEVI
jgi:hypothetical protein